jgi:hypothetical protein
MRGGASGNDRAEGAVNKPMPKHEQAFEKFVNDLSRLAELERNVSSFIGELEGMISSFREYLEEERYNE